jgi:hypothetical protein
VKSRDETLDDGLVAFLSCGVEHQFGFKATRKPKPGTVTEAGIVKITGPFSASFSGFLSFISFSASTDAYADNGAIAVTGLGLAKVKRADGHLTGNSAECPAQNLKWR